MNYCYDGQIETVLAIMLMSIFGIVVIGFFGVFFYGILRDSNIGRF